MIEHYHLVVREECSDCSDIALRLAEAANVNRLIIHSISNSGEEERDIEPLAFTDEHNVTEIPTILLLIEFEELWRTTDPIAILGVLDQLIEEEKE